jgi:hypothetical protein
VSTVRGRRRGRKKRTELHGRFEIGAAKAHHDRIGISVDDGRIVLVAVRSVILVLYLLRSEMGDESAIK